MTRPRVSIGWLLLAVALIGLHLAIVFADRPTFGLGGLEVGLLPGITVMSVVLSWGTRRRLLRRPFVRGFMVSLAVAIGIYLAACLTIAETVRSPIVYYINEIEPRFMDTDLTIFIRISLEIRGLILGVPQLLFALGGGAIVKTVAGLRRNPGDQVGSEADC